MKERSRGAKRPSLVGSLLAVTAVLASIPISAHAATGDSVRGSATLNDGGVSTITVLASGAADEQDATGTIARRSAATGLRWGGTVSCLHVDGTDAWIGYTITRSSDPTQVGDEDVLVVHDNYPKQAELGVTGDTVRIFVASSPSAAECVDEPIFGVFIFHTLSGGYTVTEGLERASIDFGQVTRNDTKGTAKLTTTVPDPGDVVLERTKQVKGDEVRAEAGGASARTSQNGIEVELTVKPRGKAKKKLNRKGKAKVKAKVTYTPDGGTPNTEAKKIKLVKR
jgi:hypothetical protein